MQEGQLLPVVRIGQIPLENRGVRWLADELWGESSVGVIGGAPKCSKTWLGLDLALSVATGTACLGRYAVPQPGPALIYLAEDALPTVRERVAGMARQRALELAAIEIHVITAPTLRLDREPQQTELTLNTATQAWVEIEYNRAEHRELACAPVQRFAQAPDVLRASPSSAALRDAFRLQETRRQRRSDGTVSVEGVRFEAPARFRHFRELVVRYARWDLSRIDLVDPRHGTSLAPLYPVDRSANADGRRAALEPASSDGSAGNEPTTYQLPPLLKQILAEYSGVLERPQSRAADFYRELGDIFAVKLSPSNRWGGFRALRDRWKAHVASSRIKPVLLVDEAQEMAPEVLNELRILCSADFDATSLLTVVLSGDGRLPELLRHEDLIPLGTRIRTRLQTEPASREELTTLLRHALSKGIDENHAGEVAGLLAYFRSLQRELNLSVILVHHTRKNTAAGVAAGQGLRGSSDIHAFGDSNLYLRRHKDQLVLSSEHRAAPAAPPVSLRLVATDAETTHLEVVGELPDQLRRSLQDQVLELLAPGVALTRAKLRESLGVKNERLGEALEALEQAGRLNRTATGWQRHN